MLLRFAIALAAALGASGCYVSHRAPADIAIDAATRDDADASAARCGTDGVACDDGDACTVGDVCAAGRCRGVPRRCDAPPGVCFEPRGACVEGACAYAVRVGAPCDDGDDCTRDASCDADGVCRGEPRRCDSPPPATCVDEASLREPRGPGTCAPGGCVYPAIDRDCPDGCVDGACLCVSSGWRGGVIDGSADVGRYTDLAVDASGVLHVAYAEVASEGRLRYARRAPGGAWSVRTVDATGDVGGSPSIAVGPDGVVHVIYDDLGRRTLLHATRAPGGTWSRAIVDGTDDAWNGALAIDADGALHVAYTDGSDPSGTRLGVAHRPPGGAWTTERVGDHPDSGLFTSIAVDAAGGLHVAHLDRIRGALEYAHHIDDEGWATSTIDGGGAAGGAVGGGNALAVDRRGTVHVAYFHPTEHLLHHAERDRTGAWTRTPIPEAAEARWSASIAIDGYDGIHVVHDLASSDLQHTYRAPDGEWRSERVGTTGYSLSYLGGTAIAIDRSGDLHVTHHDELDRTLRHAWRRYCP